MNALLLSVEDEEGGAAIVSVGGVEVVAMNCLFYGTPSQRFPCVGETFEAYFTCLFDDDDPVDLTALLGGNPLRQQRLERTGLWSYRAFGKLVENKRNGEMLVADCGGLQIPLPVDSIGADSLGAYVAFNIDRLDVWCA